MGCHGCHPAAVGCRWIASHATVDWWSTCTPHGTGGDRCENMSAGNAFRACDGDIRVLPCTRRQPSDDESTLASCKSMGWRENVQGEPKVVVAQVSASGHLRVVAFQKYLELLICIASRRPNRLAAEPSVNHMKHCHLYVIIWG